MDRHPHRNYHVRYDPQTSSLASCSTSRLTIHGHISTRRVPVCRYSISFLFLRPALALLSCPKYSIPDTLTKCCKKAYCRFVAQSIVASVWLRAGLSLFSGGKSLPCGASSLALASRPSTSEPTDSPALVRTRKVGRRQPLMEWRKADCTRPILRFHVAAARVARPGPIHVDLPRSIR